MLSSVKGRSWVGSASDGGQAVAGHGIMMGRTVAGRCFPVAVVDEKVLSRDGVSRGGARICPTACPTCMCLLGHILKPVLKPVLHPGLR